MKKIDRLDHVALVVSNLPASVEWYKNMFGLKPVYVEDWWSDTEAFLSIGETIVALFQDNTKEQEPLNKNKKGCHSAFRTDRASFEAYKISFQQNEMPHRFVDHKRTLSIYFYDPDGYEWEITTYEI